MKFPLTLQTPRLIILNSELIWFNPCISGCAQPGGTFEPVRGAFRHSQFVKESQLLQNKLYLITAQQDATYSDYYISVDSSVCFGCWHPSSGAHTTVITASGID